METTLPRLFRKRASEYPELAFQMSRFKDGHFEPTTYKEAYEAAVNFAGGLLVHGVVREEHIGLISDNRKEWEQSDMGLMMLGAIDVPRGCDATIGDLEYILSFAECKRVIVENSTQIAKILGIKEKLPLSDFNEHFPDLFSLVKHYIWKFRGILVSTLLLILVCGGGVGFILKYLAIAASSNLTFFERLWQPFVNVWNVIGNIT